MRSQDPPAPHRRGRFSCRAGQKGSECSTQSPPPEASRRPGLASGPLLVACLAASEQCASAHQQPTPSRSPFLVLLFLCSLSLQYTPHTLKIQTLKLGAADNDGLLFKNKKEKKKEGKKKEKRKKEQEEELLASRRLALASLFFIYVEEDKMSGLRFEKGWQSGLAHSSSVVLLFFCF